MHALLVTLASLLVTMAAGTAGVGSTPVGTTAGAASRGPGSVVAPDPAARVTGDFSGTTDEIIQWAACKWGFDVDTVRAQAMQESGWDQAYLGDCNTGHATQPETNGCASVGLLQVKGADLPPNHPFTYPAALISTAFNVDYTLGARRQCFEGRIPWLNDADVRGQNGRLYGSGDEWGCMGFWYSGRWYNRDAMTYLYQRSSLGEGVQNHYEQQTWLRLTPNRRGGGAAH